MSLLPGKILPQSASLGITRDKQGNITGDVIIDKDWWLLVYNIVQQSLGTNGGLSAAAIVSIEEVDSDAADTDATVLRQPISNLNVIGQDTPPASTDYPGIATSLLLSQDTLLPDPIPLSQPIVAIVVGASVFSYTAPFAGSVSVTGGTVSNISLTRTGTTVQTGLTAGVFQVSRYDILNVTYSGLPTMNFIPWSSQ
jgi:hypothetical protein